MSLFVVGNKRIGGIIIMIFSFLTFFLISILIIVSLSNKNNNKNNKKNEFSESLKIYDLVSNFGEDDHQTKYKCLGSCYCDGDENDDDEKRRSSTNVFLIKKGMVYLVGAISSVLAIQKAKEYFHQECVNEQLLSSDETTTCHLSEIKSDVETCEKKTQPSQLLKEDVPEGYKRYECRGHCVPKKFKTKKMTKVANEFGCERRKEEGFVQVDCRNIKYTCNRKAEVKFQKELLTVVCKKISSYSYLYRKSKGEKSSGTWSKVSLCKGDGKNNIKCKQISPRTKPIRRKKKKEEEEKDFY